MKQSPHFFAREGDGSVRLRIRFQPDEATMIEAAAGATPVMTWIHEVIGEAARRDIDEQSKERRLPPPT